MKIKSSRRWGEFVYSLCHITIHKAYKWLEKGSNPVKVVFWKYCTVKANPEAL
jgi:hypothetical protein